MEAQGNIIDASHQFVQKDELQLIDIVKAGDKQAFHSLYQQYLGQVYALCYRLTGDKGMAEDATQEVFIQLWRKLANYKGQSKFSTWLHSVTANITVSYIRKQKGWLQRMFNIEDSAAVNEVAEVSSDSIDLDAYIQKLPERARIVFVLHAVEGYRHEDIAKMTDMAVGSSKAQFHRAKQLLKEWMQDA